MNLYAYVGNSPMVRSDALGLTWATNAGFLWDFLTGGGATRRSYGPTDLETLEMERSVAARKMRLAFVENGCQNTRFNYGTFEAYWDTAANPLTADWSSTAVQVGGFAGGTVVNNGNGTITITIANEAGTNSFFYHAVPNRRGTSGPMRTIYQTFQFTEAVPFGCRK